VTATATTGTGGLPSSPLPPPLLLPSPHDTFFIGDDFPAAAAEESRSHAHLFGGDIMGMGGVSDEELKWDSFACPTTFSSGRCILPRFLLNAALRAPDRDLRL
jgi:hypothetical protein